MTIPIAPPPELTQRQVHVVISGLLLVLLLAALDSTIVSTALPTIVGELGGLDRLAWVVTAYLLAQTVVTPLYGKLGDLYGRKKVVQVAIAIFLVGSALCGLSQTMEQLIIFRAIQGLGGGGLIVTTQAVVGDIVPARDRGRYQGIFGAMFGLASIAGPLIGGYFTTQLSWRWIFYINLPLGLIAVFVLATTMPATIRRVTHAIDYVGAALLATALSATIIATDLGGIQYPWDSPVIIGLGILVVIATALFLIVERRAKEPVLPLRLFDNRTFVISAVVGLIVGFALFGSVTYLPLYLQIVKGDSPTASGLRMVPMMAGMLVSSIVAGQMISRTGRYKIFPIVGTATMTVGLLLLSRMTVDTTLTMASVLMMMLGLGMGLVMQVLILAAQNAVPYEDLGVATSGATLFRLIGGSVGTAALGAIFTARMNSYLADHLPAGAARAGSGVNVSPRVIAEMPSNVRDAYANAVTIGLSGIFVVAMIIALVGFALIWLLPEMPLRDTIAARAGDVGDEIGEVFPLPPDTEAPRDQLESAGMRRNS